MDSTTCLVWKAVASKDARAIWPLFEPSVRPTIVPLAFGSQFGAPSPVKDGTK